jgi:hypothetical protein
MDRQKDRYSLIVCLTSVLEFDRPVREVSEEGHGGERWSFNCRRSTEQWKVTPGWRNGDVLGHNTGTQWSFYDDRTCTHIEVLDRGDSYRVWDYGGIHPLDITFRYHTVTICEPSSGHTERFHIEA